MQPATSLEQTKLIDTIASVWEETLETAKPTVTSDFFKSGGHSLKAMLFVSKLEKDHGISLPLSALVTNPTLGALATYISENPNTSGRSFEPFSIDGKETQIEYLLHYNDLDKQAARNTAYEKYYEGALKSEAHAEFCRQVYGDNYGQHGMADFKQLDAMLAKLEAGPGDKLLDVGCGYGLISKYMSEKTGASVVGIDLAKSAVDAATARAKESDDPLSFLQMDLQDLHFPSGTFTHVVSIDTIYFTRDQRHTIKQFFDLLKPGGKIAVFRTFPKRSFTPETWKPEYTELAVILNDLFGNFEAIDFSTEENEHWAKKVEVLDNLKENFLAEGCEDLYNFRYQEAAYEATIHQFRYLFIATKR